MSITSLAVFCGSKEGSNPLYCEHAKRLGYMLAEKNITLIYGGGNKGIMGAVANAALERNGKVVGVMPKLLNGTEHSHSGISELHETEDMHSRKKMLYEKADAALILPGGYGTMDEFFEMLTWNQLDIHNKKIFVLNSGGFYDCLIGQLKKMEQEKFLYRKLNGQVTIVSEPEQLKLD
ncbi:MAG TPA: TIGR00730 family Rossman fold protein [Chitinophagaceae bacterium]|nr:TIGR00730 family Rossman fold protein [Chitinophagaceae bacterium]